MAATANKEGVVLSHGQRSPEAETTGIGDVIRALEQTNQLLRATVGSVNQLAQNLQAVQTGVAPGTVAPDTGAALTAVQVRTWEDDPLSEAVPTINPPLATPTAVPVPALPPAPLTFHIVEPRPAPALYPPGSANFRYWTAHEALARGVRFWAALLPVGTVWSTANPTLQATLVAGQDLNAYYSRPVGLRFFQATVNDITVYSGESPNVSQHELGHAVLDALKPQLFNAASIEAAAFHESFGDMSSILCMLQLPGVRQKVLNETHGRINTNSRLSRLAEQLGWAIRQGSPTAVDRDCLRNASNRFFYADPAMIPPRAPASQLSSEPHSFSRVFTGAFLDALSGMLIRQGGASDASLLAISRAMGLLLVDGVRIAQVVPRFFSQVAAGMITADRARNNGRFRGVLGNAFIRHGILSPADLARLPEAPVPQAVAAPLSEGFNTGAAGIGGFGEESYGEATLLSYGGAEDDSYRRGYGETPELPVVSLPGDYIGIPIKVHAATEPARFAVTGAAPPTGAAEGMSAERDAQHFVEDLIQLGHIEAGAAGMMAGVAGVDMIVPTGTPDGEKTHELVPDADGQSLILKRKHFDCGFGGDH